MPTSSSREIFFAGWVEGVARYIDDPVQRLRFVRVAAPSKPLAPPVPRRLRALMFPPVVGLLLFLLLSSAITYLRFHESSARPASVHSGTARAGH